MKALFYGSSLTKGNGLWMFDFDGYHKKFFDDPDWDWRNVILPLGHIYKFDNEEFMCKNRWSRLVSDYYGMEEINNSGSGGMISETVVMLSKQGRWEKIGLLSIEFYGIGRLQGHTPKEIEKLVKGNEDDHGLVGLKNWVINFDYDVEIKTQLKRLDEQLEKISKFNIPTVIHIWDHYDIKDIKNIILDYPYVDKCIMNKDEAILDWAKGKYQIHDEHPYYNKSIGKKDEHLGPNGHRKFYERIITYLGQIEKNG